MLTYRTELDNVPPALGARQKMAEMKSYAPAQGADAFNASLDLAGYQRAADAANLQYAAAHQGAQQQLALAGLTGMAGQQAQTSSLLRGLFS